MFCGKTCSRVFLLGMLLSLLFLMHDARLAGATTDAVATEAAVVVEYENPVSSRPSLVMDFVKLVFSLAVIIVLAYIFIRVLGKRIRRIQQGEHIEIVDSMPLGVNKGIHVVYAAGKYIVVGITEQNINILSEVDNDDVIQELDGKRLLNQGEADFSLPSVNWQIFAARRRRGDDDTVINKANEEGDIKAAFSDQFSSIKALRKRVGKEDRNE